MSRSKRDPFVKRPNPTLTPHEMIAKNDAMNMLNLMRDLTAYMPPPYKAQLQRYGCLSFKLGKYRVQIVECKRFEMSVEEYGKAQWGS